MASLAPSLSLPSFSPSSLPSRHRPLVLCQAFHPKSRHSEDLCSSTSLSPELNRREMLAFASSSPLLSLLFAGPAFGLLEADDDELLLEKVKEDRKKKIQKRGELNAYKKETASVQTAIYKLSKAAQALDVNDFSGASSVLGQSLDVGWIADVKAAFSKVSSSTDEQKEAETFSSALASLQSAVLKEDISSSKSAFVASASALENWSNLTGFAEQLKGL